MKPWEGSHQGAATVSLRYPGLTANRIFLKRAWSTKSLPIFAPNGLKVRKERPCSSTG